MIKLNESRVVFDEESHMYHLDGNRLMGITGLIHSILGLGVYPGANEYVSDFAIPRAGSRGTAVHHAIETYDSIGIKQTWQIVTTRYGCAERCNERIVDEEWDVSNQLDAYIRHLEGFRPIANEYTVSDNCMYASQIDNVWQKVDTGGIWLVDTKTNNLSVYPKCGYFRDDYFSNSRDALKEYLSWQLSIYAELFELCNPGLSVEGLACNWLREDEAEFWVIERKPGDKVHELLKSTYIIQDDDAVYFHPEPSKIFSLPPLVKDEHELMILPEDLIDLIYTVQKQYDDAKSKLDEMKPLLREAMESHGVKSWDSGKFKATISAGSKTKVFDTERFRKEHPDLYEEYSVTKDRRGGFTIKNR